MELNEMALPIFVMLCGVILIPAFAIMSSLIFSLAANTGRGKTHRLVPVRGGWRWKRYEHRKITGQ